MSKQDKAIINNAVWTVRLLLVLVFFLVGALCYVTLTDNPETVNQEVLKNEEAEGKSEPVVPAGGIDSFTAVSNTAEPSVTDTSCLLVKAVNGAAPDVLTVDNTVRIPPRLCLSFILGITEAVTQGLLEPKDLLYETL